MKSAMTILVQKVQFFCFQFDLIACFNLINFNERN